MRTVLITGTSSGIGKETALAAETGGWHVVATMRDPAKAQGLKDVKRLDVTDPASVQACVDEVIAERGELHAVINNAGVGVLGTAELLTADQVRTAMEVNYFGVVEVTKAALPHLRASQGRLITVTSVGGIVGQPFNEAYCAAKFAVEGYMESLAPVAATTGVRVSVVEPGAVASEFVASQQLDVAKLLAEAGPYAPAMSAYIKRTQGSFSNAQTAADCARVIVDLLEQDEPPFRVQTTDWARTFVGTKLADLDGSAVQNLTRTWVS
ncbi:SDR family oxidoreductase [Lentzea sp. NPDC005914]|uniref:SDR family oxidoreductase n=1 Tax=Lentzea sp. NPDC005914 TaxID=3154572 RepID=UPI0033FDEFB5